MGEMYLSLIDFEGRHESKEIDSGTFGPFHNRTHQGRLVNYEFKSTGVDLFEAWHADKKLTPLLLFIAEKPDGFGRLE